MLSDAEDELHTGVYISKPGVLRPLADDVTKVMNNTGAKLIELGYIDFVSQYNNNSSPRLRRASFAVVNNLYS